MIKYLNRISLTAEYEYIKLKILNEMNQIEMMINKYQELNIDDRYELIKHFYTIYLDNFDIIDLINIKNATDYTDLVELETKMEYKTIKEKKRCILKAATNCYFNPSERRYSYKDINKLIEKKIIYPVYITEKRIPSFSKDYEDTAPIDCFVPNQIVLFYDNYFRRYTYMIEPSNKELLLKLFESNLTHEDIVDDLKGYMYFLKEEIARISWRIDYPDKDIVDKYNEFYNEHNQIRKKIK